MLPEARWPWPCGCVSTLLVVVNKHRKICSTTSLIRTCCRSCSNSLSCQWHPVAPSGTQWHPVAPSGTQWHPVAPSGTQWHPVAPSGTQWHPVAPSGTQWHPVAPSGTQWHPVAPSGTQWHPVAPCNTGKALWKLSGFRFSATCTAYYLFHVWIMWIVSVPLGLKTTSARTGFSLYSMEALTDV